MNKSQYSHITAIDDFEDLTLFVNESFDTDDVDLFEFISEESSPLTKLKSIILSLDWEINDEILNELDDEIGNLNDIWYGDKVAEVYMQGLSKIGSYIRAKGAYAHPNSIKLLLTFFYDFEKIISSANITGDEITNILKGDVRKFKILQYQINQSELISTEKSDIHADPEERETSSGQPEAITKQNAGTLLRAAILSLDWEVTNENLRHFNEKTDALRNLITDKLALILIQGLQALGDYIADERADAHPDSFILLHSFNDALETVMKTGDQRLDQEQIQDILIDQINRLNNLKMFIASPSGAEVDNQKLDRVFEELGAPSAENTSNTAPSPPIAPDPEPSRAETALSPAIPATPADDLAAELDLLFSSGAIPAMESADVQYPDEVLPPDAIYPIDDELADDFIESHLSNKHGLAPALSDADETAGFDADTELLDFPAQSDLVEQLDSFFTDADSEEEANAAMAATLDAKKLALASEDDQSSPAALTEDEEQPAGDSVVAALSDAEVPADRGELAAVFLEAEGTGLDSLAIQSKLDSFFADADDKQDKPAPVPATEIEATAQSFADDGELDMPALGVAEMDLASLDMQNNLDNFFADDEQGESTPIPATEIEEAAQDFSGEDELDTVALELEEVDLTSLELQSDLDNFFADDEQGEPAPVPATEAEEAEQDFSGEDELDAVALEVEEMDVASLALQNDLDNFFADGKQDEPVPIPVPEAEETEHVRVFNGANDLEAALADSNEERGFSEENALDAVSGDGMDLGSLEIQSKLDSFFADADAEQDESAPVPAPEAETTGHARVANEANDLQTALADSDEEVHGFLEEDKLEDLNFTPMDEIEEKLNLFFGSDDDTIGDIAPLAGSLEESLGFDLADPVAELAHSPTPAHLDASRPDVEVTAPADEIETEQEQAADVAPPETDELTKALEATLDRQPPAPSVSSINSNSAKIQLATLGALLPQAVRTPSRDNLAQSAAIIGDLKQADLSPTQHALIQLLESTLTLLVRLPTKDHAASEKLVDYLYEQLLANHGQADVLSETVDRFTAWLGGRVMPIVPAAGKRPEPPANYTTKELYIELTELRTTMREEFAKLQHEMRHSR